MKVTKSTPSFQNPIGREKIVSRSSRYKKSCCDSGGCTNCGTHIVIPVKKDKVDCTRCGHTNYRGELVTNQREARDLRAEYDAEFGCIQGFCDECGSDTRIEEGENSTECRRCGNTVYRDSILTRERQARRAARQYAHT